MPNITIKITGLGNAAFADVPEREVARILRKTADLILSDPARLDAGEQHDIQDINGNTVGYLKVNKR